jgi:hypothetical protein
MRWADTSYVRDLQQSDADCYTYSDGYSNAYGNGNTYSYGYATTHANPKIPTDAQAAPDPTPPVLICV